MSLTPPEKVRKLQETLHAKAKRAPTYRFYALYDKLYRSDVLSHAYACCAACAEAWEAAAWSYSSPWQGKSTMSYWLKAARVP